MVVPYGTLRAVAWLCCVAFVSHLPARAQTSPENVRVTDSTSGFTFQAETTLVLDQQGRILAGWKEMNVINGFDRVGFGRSLDGGQTWLRSLMDVLTPSQRQTDPWLAIDEFDRIYFSRPGAPGIMLSRSDDGGVTWGPLVDLHDQTNSADKSSIKSDGNGRIYATYVNFGPTAPFNMKIIFRRSVDGGVTWSPGQVLVTGLNPFAPVIATRPNGTVHVVWWAPVSASAPGGNIIARTSTDGGANWGPAVRVNSVSGSAVFEGFTNPIRIPYPSVATNGSARVFVAWADKGKGNYNIVVARSEDGGATWSTPVQVNDVDTGDHWMAALTVDVNDVLHAAWYDSRTGNINLFYANSTDGGSTWSSNLRITTQETPGDIQSLGEYIGLAADGNSTAYMAWADGRDGGLDIYFARTPDAANPVPTLTSLSPSSATAGGAGFTLTVSGSNFVNGSVERWNGVDQTTAFVNAQQLTATILASDIASAGQVDIAVFSPGPGGGTSNPLTFTILPAPPNPPAINSGGVINAASFTPAMGLAPGSITAVFGTDLAATTEVATLLPLPTILGGAQMQFNASVPVPKFFASALQVNIQVPWELAGQMQATLTNTVGPATSSGEVVPLAPFSPGLFATNQQGTGQGAILIANTPNLAAPMGMFPGSRPAVRGVDFLEIYWTGGGAVANQPPSGAAASSNPLSATTTTPTVTIGGVGAPVLFSGLAPGFVGLYVVTLQVPGNAPIGPAVPVVLTLGVQSNSVTIAVD